MYTLRSVLSWRRFYLSFISSNSVHESRNLTIHYWAVFLITLYVCIMYYVGLGRISGSAGLSGRIFHFAGYPARLSDRILNFAELSGRISGIYGRIRQAPDTRHPARNTRSGPTLEKILKIKILKLPGTHVCEL